MFSSLSAIFSSLSARILPAAAAAPAMASIDSASRSIPMFESPSAPRTYPDRTSSITERLRSLSVRGEVLAERFDWLVQVSQAQERPFYTQATYHLDRLLQLDPWFDGQNTAFEYTAYQIFEAIVMNKDIASFVYFMSFMGGQKSVPALEALAVHEKMGTYFGLVDGVLPPATKHFEYDRAANTVLTLGLFGPVRPEILRFLSTAVLKREGKLPAAGIASDAYCTSAGQFVEAFGYGLEHPRLGPRVRKAIQAAAAHPLGFLKMNRLAHLLMNRHLEEKISEFVPEKPGLSSLLNHIEAARREVGPAAHPALGSLKDCLSAHPTPLARLLAESIGKEVAVESYSAKAFEGIVKLSKRISAEKVEAIYSLPQGARGRALIQMRANSPFEEAVLALHEFVHVQQEKRHGLGWVDRHVLAAEREALAEETLFRIVNGDHRLYNVIAALSPEGFESGLWIAAEQLYLRLKDLPV